MFFVRRIIYCGHNPSDQDEYSSLDDCPDNKNKSLKRLFKRFYIEFYLITKRNKECKNVIIQRNTSQIFYYSLELCSWVNLKTNIFSSIDLFKLHCLL